MACFQLVVKQISDRIEIDKWRRGVAFDPPHLPASRVPVVRWFVYNSGVTKRTYTFPRSHRLGGRIAFSRVFDGRTTETRGPLRALAVPNGLGHPRLGISIGRRVGTAPRRNRIKRLLREAFRMHQHDLPAGYDLVVVVRPHEPLSLADYQKLLTHFLLRLHIAWERRGRAAANDPPTADASGGPAA